MVINLCYVHTSYLYKYFIFYLAEVICFIFIQGQSRNLASLLLFYSISLHADNLYGTQAIKKKIWVAKMGLKWILGN